MANEKRINGVYKNRNDAQRTQLEATWTEVNRNLIETWFAIRSQPIRHLQLIFVAAEKAQTNETLANHDHTDDDKKNIIFRVLKIY